MTAGCTSSIFCHIKNKINTVKDAKKINIYILTIELKTLQKRLLLVVDPQIIVM